MKYEFIKNGKDDYTLKYKDQQINFKSTIDVATRLQESIEKGKNNLIFDLAKQGLTVKSLAIETKKDGKTYVDNSNYEMLEQNYINKSRTDIFMEIVEELFNKKFTDLIIEMELTEKEMAKFGEDLGNILKGNFPSK